jgi:hypothetical protein
VQEQLREAQLNKETNKAVEKFLKAATNPRALARAFPLKMLVAYASALVSAIMIQVGELEKTALELKENQEKQKDEHV